MCFGPEMLASLALSGVGNAIQTSQNNASARAQQNARNAAVAQGIQEQAVNQQKSGAEFDKALNHFTPENQQHDLGALVTSRTNALSLPANQIPATGNTTTASESTPNVVQSDLAKRLADATAFGVQQAGALGKIGAYGDQAVGNDISTLDSSRKVASISDFAARQAQINRLKQQVDASNAARPASGIGSILGLVGSAGVNDAAGGGHGFSRISNWLSPPTTGGPVFGPWQPDVYGPFQ